MDLGGSGGQLMIKMQNYLAGEFVYLVQKLKSYPEGSGTVLDNSVVVWRTQTTFTSRSRRASGFR
jgi:hypothetical protein